MIIKSEYMGKRVKILTADDQEYSGKVVEMEGPEATESGEPEIGINYAGGIRMFAESELDGIELLKK